MKPFILPLLLITTFGISNAQAKQVNSLSEVPATINNTAGKTAYLEQMNGNLPPNPYQALPKHINPTQLLHWLAPNEKPQNLIFSGMRRWQNDQQFIVVACFAKSTEAAQYALKQDGYQCALDYNTDNHNRFYLGVIETNENNFVPIAMSGLIETKMTGHIGDDVTPQSYGYLDLAPYQISPDSMAFGLRTQFVDGYAGGGVISHNLILFRIHEQKLDMILNTPIYQLEDLAGEWNPDGSRQRHVSETNTTVIMRPTQTLGFYDLMLKTGKEKTILKWNGKQYQ